MNPLEFAVEQDILVRGHRIVIPKEFQPKILEELHIGHFGMIKMKNLTRGYC